MSGFALIWEIDTGNFSKVIDSLQDLSGKTREQILLSETAQILRICFKRTPPTKKRSVATAKDAARRRVEKPMRYIGTLGTLVPVKDNRVPRPVPLEHGKPYLQTLTGTRGGQQGRQWMTIRNRAGRRFYLTGEKLRGQKFDLLFQNFVRVGNAVRARADAAVAAVGSMKKSWLQIGDALGIDVSRAIKEQGVELARAARSLYNDGSGSRIERTADSVVVLIQNTNGALIRHHDGARMLQSAVRTREAAFHRNVAHGVFADLRARAARYPGIFTN